ncbi:histone-lysine N-methyltransferase SETDB1-A-like [Nerophis ophidion]|uniref:histone-lysine N-methyltransferase SETDB1-A-like n=1 Tax=Nerophis ophidion TaxID=159077 RepID=UPI002ADF7D97|nr:histone-lysine N-methyltransferase SETDB1-A-like [Nerophis ophidion]XP_061738147.1 histone-lysine N-methyltransferase SETDB1-A-like [Nerophis ophidion]
MEDLEMTKEEPQRWISEILKNLGVISPDVQEKCKLLQCLLENRKTQADRLVKLCTSVGECEAIVKKQYTLLGWEYKDDDSDDDDDITCYEIPCTTTQQHKVVLTRTSSCEIVDLLQPSPEDHPCLSPFLPDLEPDNDTNHLNYSMESSSNKRRCVTVERSPANTMDLSISSVELSQIDKATVSDATVTRKPVENNTQNEEQEETKLEENYIVNEMKEKRKTAENYTANGITEKRKLIENDTVTEIKKKTKPAENYTPNMIEETRKPIENDSLKEIKEKIKPAENDTASKRKEKRKRAENDTASKTKEKRKRAENDTASKTKEKRKQTKNYITNKTKENRKLTENDTTKKTKGRQKPAENDTIMTKDKRKQTENDTTINTTEKGKQTENDPSSNTMEKRKLTENDTTNRIKKNGKPTKKDKANNTKEKLKSAQNDTNKAKQKKEPEQNDTAHKTKEKRKPKQNDTANDTKETRKVAENDSTSKEINRAKREHTPIIDSSVFAHTPHETLKTRPELPKEEIKVDMVVLAKKNNLRWHRGQIVEVVMKENGRLKYKVIFEEKGKRLVSCHHIAFETMPKLEQLYVGARVVVKCQDDATLFRDGILAELPCKKNRLRFLVFLDNHKPIYVGLTLFHLVCRPLPEPVEDIQDEAHRSFMAQYLRDWPYPHLTQYKSGQTASVEFNDEYHKCKVELVDSSLMKVLFKFDQHKEWIHRGSMRLEHMPRFLEMRRREADGGEN